MGGLLGVDGMSELGGLIGWVDRLTLKFVDKVE